MSAETFNPAADGITAPIAPSDPTCVSPQTDVAVGVVSRCASGPTPAAEGPQKPAPAKRITLAEYIKLPKEKKALVPLVQRDIFRAEMVKKQAALLAAYPHLGFKPNPPQARWLKMIDEGVRLRGHYDYAALWATWTGKTTLWVNFIWNLTQSGGKGAMAKCFEELGLVQNWGWTDSKGKFHAFPKHIRLGCSSKQMMEFTGTIWKEIQNWWPKDKSWKAVKQGLDYPSAFQLPNGWTMEVMAFDRPATVKESDTVGLYITDEPPPLQDWQQAAGRRKKGGLRIMHGTMVLDTPDAPQLFEELNGSCEVMYARVEENFKSNGGFLEDEITIEMMKAWAEDDREARLTGKPVFLRGVAFNVSDVHFIIAERVPRLAARCVVVDPHPRKPWFMTVQGRDAYGNHFLLDEWPRPLDFGGKLFHKIDKDTRGVGFFAKQIKRLAFLWHADFFVLDYRYANQQQREDEYAVTTLNKLRDTYGLEFEKGSGVVWGEDGGVAELNDALLVEPDAMGEAVARLRIVRENCLNTVHMLETVTWKEKGGEFGSGKKLDPKFDDGPRSLMYGLMAPWETYAPIRPITDEFAEHDDDYYAMERKALDGFAARRLAREAPGAAGLGRTGLLAHV